jgi:CheY-like chemotaxis protein
LPAKLLVAEDDGFVRIMIAEFLRNAGYEVTEANDADEAIGIFQTGAPIDLLFSDIRMPGSMDGCDLAKRVHAEWPNTRVILTTGYSNTLPKARRTMDDPVLEKPYRPQQVLETIRSLIES